MHRPPARSAARVGLDAPGTSRSARATQPWRAVLLAACVVLAGCAYFNTFYNANQFYKEAERLRAGPGGADAAAATYGQAIDKCHDLLRNHAESGYVDDALFMIGMSHLHRRENVQSQDSFRDLLDRFPDTEFRERAWFYMGLAALRMGDIGSASASFDALRTEFPASDYNVEAVYRSAERQLDSRDNDAAREALEVFIVEHPKSPFTVEAQAMIARTYFDEQRYEDARLEFEDVLGLSPSDLLRYEAQLHVALSKRNQAEQILADPSLYTADDLPDGLRIELPKEQPADSSHAGDAPNDGSAAASRPSLTASNADIATSLEALPDSLRALREQAFDLLRQAEKELHSLRKAARKRGFELALRVDLALTVAFLGNPDAAISELDQIARSDPRGNTGAEAQYAIGEIHRRRGNLQAAQQAYDAAQRIARNSDAGQAAIQRGLAIRARAAALEQLKDAPEVLRRWRIVQGQEEPADADSDLMGADSTSARLEVDLRFEEFAAHLLRVAEIDLLELDQPRLALREFQRVLRDYPGSGSSARAAFAIGWIYEMVLLDAARALAAYDNVVRDYPRSPQARQARESAQELRTALTQSATEVEPSTRP